MNKITCSECGNEIEIDKALEGQIEERVLASERHKHKEELLKIEQAQNTQISKIRTRAAELANKQLKGEKELLKSQSEADLELARKKMLQEASNQQRKSTIEQEELIKGFKEDALNSKEDNKKLRSDLSSLMDQLRESNKAKDNAELDAKKKLIESEQSIRDEAVKNADEKFRLKIAEQEKKLSDTQKALEQAQRKANQGSQQNQGEVLELELEQQLAAEFPLDDIDEVKKGARGADVKQTVRTENLQSAGLLLWETKNGRWQPAWVPKFKNDIRESNANIGVIVSQEMPAEYGDMENLDKNVWVVKPRLAVVLASALRSTILQVSAMSKMNIGKDAKMEALFSFISGPEFKHRVEGIIEHYGMLQDEMEKEKRAAQLRWSRQEKSIRAVIDNTIGMYGDLQGITSKALPIIESLESDTGDEPLHSGNTLL